MAGFLGITTTGWATEVAVCTDSGSFTIELFDEQAPAHAANFLRYVDEGFYSGTVFHRVVADFVVQGGGYDRQLRQRETFDAIQNEARNGLSNVRGTVAAARTSDPDSATSQFFVNLRDSRNLDATATEPGYTVFGRVTDGIETLDEIGELPTAAAGPLSGDVPDPLVAISSMAVLDRAALEALPEEGRLEFVQKEISDAAALNDGPRTLEWVRHFRALCAPLDSYTLLIEANAALSQNQFRRAQYVLDDYFAITDPSHPSYSTAQAFSRNLARGPQPTAQPFIARCEVPTTPDLPNGSVDSLEQMIAGQTTVRDFMNEADMYLDCLSDAIDDRSLSDEQHADAVQRHNRMVGLMEQLAAEFNQQVRAFKAREP